jgi:hypothetical protein
MGHVGTGTSCINRMREIAAMTAPFQSSCENAAPVRATSAGNRSRCICRHRRTLTAGSKAVAQRRANAGMNLGFWHLIAVCAMTEVRGFLPVHWVALFRTGHGIAQRRRDVVTSICRVIEILSGYGATAILGAPQHVGARAFSCATESA